MGKLVEIESCVHCKHNLWSAVWCCKEKKVIPKLSSIPSWCSLPDKVEILETILYGDISEVPVEGMTVEEYNALDREQEVRVSMAATIKKMLEV